MRWLRHVFLLLIYMDFCYALILTCIYALDLHKFLLWHDSDMYLCPYSTWIFDVLWPWHVFMCLFYMDISCAMALTCIYILDLHGYLLHFDSDMYLYAYFTWMFVVPWSWHVFTLLICMDIWCALILTCIYAHNLHEYLMCPDPGMYLHSWFAWIFVALWSWHVLIHLLYVKIIRIIFLTWKYDRSIGFCLIKPQKPKPLGLRFELML